MPPELARRFSTASVTRFRVKAADTSHMYVMKVFQHKYEYTNWYKVLILMQYTKYFAAADYTESTMVVALNIC